MIRFTIRIFDGPVFFLPVFFLLVCLLFSPFNFSTSDVFANAIPVKKPKVIKEFNPFVPLKNRLIRDGFSAETILPLYARDKIVFDTKGISLYFVHNEGSLDYDQFAAPASVNKARKYMKVRKDDLHRAQERHGVDKEIVTAILLVETRLGTFWGKRSVLSTLSTMAALSDQRVRQKLWDAVKKTTHLKKKAFEKIAGQKSDWAYRELKAFLTYTTRENMDPSDIPGSYAGALGIPQFIPTSVLSYAVDGNNDNRIDLFDHADAIMSVANYLGKNGWRPGIERKKAFAVVYTYNHSKYYVNTVLKIGDILKGKTEKKGKKEKS